MARPSLFQHRKFRTLSRLVKSKAVAVGSLELLWAVANESGDPLIGAPEDVEDVADWHGKPGVLAAALVTCGFLDATPDGLVVHDHAHHCPSYVQKRRQREDQRRTYGYSRDRNGLPYSVVDAVFAREQKCAQCGSTDRLEIDHITPRAAGGGNELANLQLLCMSCNKKKGAKNRTAVDSSDQPLMSERTAVGRTPNSPLPSPLSPSESTRARTPLGGTHNLHAKHAMCGSPCVPEGSWLDLVAAASGDEAVVRAYVHQVWAEVAGQPPPLDLFKFWRTHWEADHPQPTAAELRQHKAEAAIQAWVPRSLRGAS